jgi:hypothetical protein
VKHDESRIEASERIGPEHTHGWRILFLVLLGSAWGLSELEGGPTVWLTGVALLLLTVARSLVNRPGSSTGLALIAVLFKSVNTAPFPCHLVGIGLLGLAFDVTATLLWRDDRRRYLRAALVGGIAAYGSCLLFAVSMVWIFAYGPWAGGGLSRIAEYTLSSGSRGALTGLIVAPVGLWIGHLLTRQALGHPQAVLRSAAAGCLALWVLGPFIG